jgi:HKD family nuclease
MPDKIDDGEEDAKQEETLQAVEKVLGKIEIQKVNETMICVDFSRKAGSSWLFYEKFNFIQKDLAELSDAKYEPTF